MRKNTITINKLHYYLTLILLVDKSVSHAFIMKNVHSFMQPRIHGGRQADPHQFSYQVSIRRLEPSAKNQIEMKRITHYCGGALISDRWHKYDFSRWHNFGHLNSIHLKRWSDYLNETDHLSVWFRLLQMDRYSGTLHKRQKCRLSKQYYSIRRTSSHRRRHMVWHRQCDKLPEPWSVPQWYFTR